MQEDVYLRLNCETQLGVVVVVSHQAWAGMAGAAPGGELDVVAQINVEPAVKCINENRDVIVGVKVRLTADIAAQVHRSFGGIPFSLKIIHASLPFMCFHLVYIYPRNEFGSVSRVIHQQFWLTV